MKTIIFLLSLLVIGAGLRSQNLDIQGKARIDSPDTVVALEINGGGVMLPRMTTAERNSISNPQLGLIILNTTINCLEIYFHKWTTLCSFDYTTNPVNNLIGGSENDFAKSIAPASDGGYTVAGYSFSSASGDVSDPTNGGIDCWIIKINNGGLIEWETLFGGDGSDQTHSIARIPDGYILAGESSSSANGDVMSTTNGENDYWIVQLNETGSIVWETLLGGGENDFAKSIAPTSDSGYIVAGYSFSSASGDVSDTTNGGADYWIVKLDSGGNIEWESLFGGDGLDAANSIIQTSDGGYIVAGRSGSSANGDVSGVTNGNDDYWIVKLNSGGDIEWDTLLGGSGYDQAYSIAQTTDGGYIVGGWSSSSNSGDVSGVNNGGGDYWIVKLNSGGGIEWESLLGGGGDDFAWSIVHTSDGGFITTGWSASSDSGDVSGMNKGLTDYWTVKLDNGGGIEWETLLGGSGFDRAYAIAETSDGGFIVVGDSESSASGEVLETSNGGMDYWIITLNKFGKLLK
jgi:hypothetical protein